MRKRIITACLAVAAVATLAGCGASTEGKTGSGQVTSKYVDLPDGSQALCIFWVPVDNMGVATAEGAQMVCDFDTLGATVVTP